MHICNPPGWWASSHLDNHSGWNESLYFLCHSNGDQWAPWNRGLLVNEWPVKLLSRRLSRFLELSTYLHFATNIAARGQPEYDRLAKVRPVITALQKSFLEANNPYRENAIDEDMIKFKGRSSLKQYLPMKPIKRGFKVWVRADSHNGYMCNFDIYIGKEKSTEVNLGAKVVKKLSRTLVGKRYHLYFDNFFSSVSLKKKKKYTLRPCVLFCIFLLCCVAGPNALKYCKVTSTSILQASRKSHAYQEIWARKQGSHAMLHWNCMGHIWK